MTDDLDRLRRSFTHALLLAGRQWRRAADAVAQGHGLSDATALPLVMIGRLDGAPRQTALAEAVGIEGPSLVRLLDQLAAAGLVRRAEDPSDRRAKVLSLTPAGEAAVAAIEAELTALRAGVFAEVRPEDLEAACRVLQAVMRHGRGTPSPAPAGEPGP